MSKLNLTKAEGALLNTLMAAAYKTHHATLSPEDLALVHSINTKLDEAYAPKRFTVVASYVTPEGDFVVKPFFVAMVDPSDAEEAVQNAFDDASKPIGVTVHMVFEGHPTPIF